ncbi:hypothetical protein OSTOST_00082 [Ostertagia ostertagi]
MGIQEDTMDTFDDVIDSSYECNLVCSRENHNVTNEYLGLKSDGDLIMLHGDKPRRKKISSNQDQRKLFDQLLATTTQLESKGENLESPWLLSKLLSKFSEGIQRRTLREKVSLPNGETWTMKKLMTVLDKVIKQEEEIEQCMPQKENFLMK